MKTNRIIKITLAGLLLAFAASGYPSANALENNANCSYSKTKPKFRDNHQAGELTARIVGRLAPAASKSRIAIDAAADGTIDRHLFDAMTAARIVPAQNCSDAEFIRRVTLDLTGRIPVPERVETFLKDTAADKRAKLIEELLAKPEWVDKWAMFFGGLFRNFSNPGFTPARGAGSRDAFNKWIRESLTTAKPYNQWPTELLTAIGEDSTKQGELNWLTGTLTFASLRVGVLQETYDQQALFAADNFLGVSQMDCILCHDGAGHLDDISLWGRNATRADAWGLASFFSRTDVVQAGGGTGGGPPQQAAAYAVRENTARTNRDYFLDGVPLGNRPARSPIDGKNEIAPRYPFSGKTAVPGERYRVTLAREISNDKLLAIAIVNRLWKEFFVLGLVEPTNELDPARLDPDSPPPAPWNLQASNPRLLAELAQEFITAKYDLKWLMRQIANSRAYQLSARYDGAWNSEWDKLYARKLVRRMWAEEVHDAIAQSSGIFTPYKIGESPTINYAMQFPETFGMPVSTITFGQMGVPIPPTGPPDPLAHVTVFLDSFLRGDNNASRRSDEVRINQALELFNNKFVLDRVKAANADGIVAKSLSLTDEQLVNKFFYAVLSRLPSETEKSLALSNLKKGSRTEQAENLLWALYNKADFIYNY
ncbi:MAG: DUF1549 domain-containing protein [Acidobacteriota bacterium]|nr:DUF1549 domain-containing protein [Acidobacteriota bacterium]